MIMVSIDGQLMYTTNYNCPTSNDNGVNRLTAHVHYLFNCSTNNGNGVNRLTAHVHYNLQLFYQ